MTTTDTTPEDRPSVSEMSQSLTGYDEIAIAKHMGMDPYTEGEEKPMMLMRSLVFVDQTRKGLDGTSARQAALSMTVGALHDYFGDDEPELPDTPPETPEGKDEPASEPQPTS